MQAAKVSVLCASLFWLDCPESTQDKTEDDFLWSSSTVQVISVRCNCHVEYHPDFEALPVSLTGSGLIDFLHSEGACGVAEVNGNQTKGRLIISDNCNALKSVPGVSLLTTLKPNNQNATYAFWSY